MRHGEKEKLLLILSFLNQKKVKRGAKKCTLEKLKKYTCLTVYRRTQALVLRGLSNTRAYGECCV